MRVENVSHSRTQREFRQCRTLLFLDRVRNAIAGFVPRLTFYNLERQNTLDNLLFYSFHLLMRQLLRLVKQSQTTHNIYFLACNRFQVALKFVFVFLKGFPSQPEALAAGVPGSGTNQSGQ